MKFATFAQLWQAKHPGAIVQLSSAPKGITLNYSATGRLYTYRGSVYAIAERFSLIPRVNIETEARRVAGIIRQGETVIAPAGLGDTLATLFGTWGAFTVTSAGRDEYDRDLSTYSPAATEARKWWLHFDNLQPAAKLVDVLATDCPAPRMCYSDLKALPWAAIRVDGEYRYVLAHTLANSPL